MSLQHRCNTDELSIPLCRSAKREILGVVARHHEVGTARVGAAVKPVGKLDVRNGHVQFDERGRENNRWPVRSRSSALSRLYGFRADFLSRRVDHGKSAFG